MSRPSDLRQSRSGVLPQGPRADKGAHGAVPTIFRIERLRVEWRARFALRTLYPFCQEETLAPSPPHKTNVVCSGSASSHVRDVAQIVEGAP
jgi:hypothetical protein